MTCEEVSQFGFQKMSCMLRLSWAIERLVTCRMPVLLNELLIGNDSANTVSNREVEKFGSPH